MIYIIWPEKRWVSDSQITSWAFDPYGNSVISSEPVSGSKG